MIKDSIHDVNPLKGIEIFSILVYIVSMENTLKVIAEGKVIQ